MVRDSYQIYESFNNFNMSKSLAWNFFKKPETAQDFAECKICSRSVKNKGGNTSNLIQHLRRAHPSQHETMTPSGRKSAQANDSTEVTQPTVKSFFAKATLLTPSNKRHESTTDAITCFLYKDNAPFNPVSRPGFQKLLKVLEPRYVIPDQKTFRRTKSRSYIDID